MTTDQTLVIVGASLAGAKAAEGARSAGFDGRVVLVGDEQEAAVRATPAVQGRAARRGRPETTRVHDDDFYGAHGIELLTGRSVEALDPEVRRSPPRRRRGGVVHRRRATTGAAPRRLKIPGSDLRGSTICARSAIRAAR